MEGAEINAKSLVEFSLRFVREQTILWTLFGIGVNCFQSSLEDQRLMDTNIRNDMVPTRCDFGFFHSYYAQLGDEGEHVKSYEPEKGPNAIVLVTEKKRNVLRREFPGFVKVIEACADLENASKNLGFENGEAVVCPTHVELEENTLILHISCYIPKEMGKVYVDRVRQRISDKYACYCSIYRWQNP